MGSPCLQRVSHPNVLHMSSNPFFFVASNIVKSLLPQLERTIHWNLYYPKRRLISLTPPVSLTTLLEILGLVGFFRSPRLNFNSNRSRESLFRQTLRQTSVEEGMDTAIDLSDASKALDLGNIRFQLVYVLHTGQRSDQYS